MNLLLEVNKPLSDALRMLDSENVEVIFIVDQGVLVGSLTNGDIRRKMAAGATNTTNLRDVMNSNPHFVNEYSSPQAIYREFTKGVSCIPVLNTSHRVVDVLRKDSGKTIPISEPNLSGREIELVNEALSSNWISSAGIYVQEFEQMFATFTGANYALSVCNGTQAIALALSSLEINPGDEVIIPALTFGATANAVIQVGAIPVFADIEESSYGLSLKNIEPKVSPKTKAILLVHLYGRPVKLREILEFAEQKNIKVIEDCAEAIGTTHRGKHVGTESDAGTFSFFANKTITTGEGGMVTFKNREAFEKAKLVRSHGFDPSNRYWHLTWGTNMRMTNIQAAIGVGQMERVDKLISRKIEIARIYNLLFLEKMSNIIVVRSEIDWGQDSSWLYVLEFTNGTNIQGLTDYLASKKIETRRIFPPLPIQPAFSKYATPNDIFPASTQLYDRAICLPSSTNISQLDQIEVVRKIADFINQDRNEVL